MLEVRAKDKDKLAGLDLRESLCNQCGRCCRGKTWRCEHLNSSNRCNVYQSRFQVDPYCQNIQVAILLGILPLDCPYVTTNWEKIKDWYEPVGRNT